jgi:hypothetical protein
MKWADSTDDDGLGEIPHAWIKQESVSIDLSWTSPVDNNDTGFSFENLMREISANHTTQDKEKVFKRNAKMKNARVKPAQSISNTTTENASKSQYKLLIFRIMLRQPLRCSTFPHC